MIISVYYWSVGPLSPHAAGSKEPAHRLGRISCSDPSTHPWDPLPFLPSIARTSPGKQRRVTINRVKTATKRGQGPSRSGHNHNRTRAEQQLNTTDGITNNKPTNTKQQGDSTPASEKINKQHHYILPIGAQNERRDMTPVHDQTRQLILGIPSDES